MEVRAVCHNTQSYEGVEDVPACYCQACRTNRFCQDLSCNLYSKNHIQSDWRLYDQKWISVGSTFRFGSKHTTQQKKKYQCVCMHFCLLNLNMWQDLWVRYPMLFTLNPCYIKKNSIGWWSGVLRHSRCAATKQNDFPSLFSNIEGYLKPPGEKSLHSLMCTLGFAAVSASLLVCNIMECQLFQTDLLSSHTLVNPSISQSSPCCCNQFVSINVQHANVFTCIYSCFSYQWHCEEAFELLKTGIKL